MTRINTVDPKMLSNPHLLAEFRELPRIFTAIYKKIDQGISPEDLDIPENYKLGTGHVMFFMNKADWLRGRYMKLYEELDSRNFNLNEDLYNSILIKSFSICGKWSVHWTPNPEDHYLNMARLARRSKMDNVLEELKSSS